VEKIKSGEDWKELSLERENWANMLDVMVLKNESHAEKKYSSEYNITMLIIN